MVVVNVKAPCVTMLESGLSEKNYSVRMCVLWSIIARGASEEAVEVVYKDTPLHPQYDFFFSPCSLSSSLLPTFLFSPHSLGLIDSFFH